VVKNFSSRQGQATTEMAVFGIIILVIFGVLLRYGQMFNAQQEAQMYAFRKSLELAQKRCADGKFGSVSLVAMKEYIPVDLFSSEPQVNYATGSSTVTIDPKQTYYDIKDPQPEHSPVTYYQVGNQMIKDNDLIEAPYMFVKRRRDETKAPRTPLDGVVNVLKWINEHISGSNYDDYEAYESAPFWETTQNTGGAYSSRERRTNYYAYGPRSNYAETSTQNLNTTSVYEVQPVAKIYASDELIEQVSNVPPNMVIEQNQTIEKERSYSAWD